MALLISVPPPGAIVLLTEAAECQRAEGEAQIAQRYVEVARKYKQVDNDGHEPGCDDVGEKPRLESHPDACGDLDHPTTAIKRLVEQRLPRGQRSQRHGRRADVMKRVLEISINEPIGTKSFLTRIEPHVWLMNRLVFYSIGKPEVNQTLFS